MKCAEAVSAARRLRPEALTVLENKSVTEGHYLLRLESPRIARSARPGQFVQVLVGESADPLLARPFSFLTTDSTSFTILYQVVGRGTRLLSLKQKGDALTVLGPLGCGWKLPAKPARDGSWALVGGGVGIPPIFHWAQKLIRDKKASPDRIEVFLGGRTSRLLHCQKDFRRLGVNLHLSTDDGSRGRKGFVTAALDDFVSKRKGRAIPVYACGPTPMLRAVSAVSARYGLDCQVSVEEPMPCGFGVCLGCAIRVKDPVGGERFALACAEGPVFDGSRIVWEGVR